MAEKTPTASTIYTAVRITTHLCAADADAGGRVRRDEYFAGSTARVLPSDPLDPAEADCLFRVGEGNLGICPTVEEMRVVDY